MCGQESDVPEAAADRVRRQIDVSTLPDLPPPGSGSWGRRRNPGRWRALGCGCGSVILAALILVTYQGLRDQVWSSFAKVRRGLERSILVDVDPDEKQRLLDNLERFETVISASDDPYPAIGRFIGAGREALADFVVESEEAARLNRLLEDELSTSAADAMTP